MTDSELQELAKGAEAMPPERRRDLRSRLPRWGDLYDLNGIVEGLRCARDLVLCDGFASSSLDEMAAFAADELLHGRAETAKARANPSPELVALAEMDQAITAGLRMGKSLEEVMEEVDRLERQTKDAARNGVAQGGHA